MFKNTLSPRHNNNSTSAFPRGTQKKNSNVSASTADSEQVTAPTQSRNSDSLKRVKKAIIVTLTQASFDFDEESPEPSSKQFLDYFSHLKSKFRRLFVQEFHTKEILLFAMELFRKVVDHAEASQTSFNRGNDSLFKIFVTCFFVANKFVDEMHYISMDDIAYMGHTSEEVIRSLEAALLSDVLGWNLLDLKAKDSKGQYLFLRWDYRQVLRCFKKMHGSY